MLTLLSWPEGASIEEMMRAAEWQKHSVRGMLAGTVKKKLGFRAKASTTSGTGKQLPVPGSKSKLWLKSFSRPT